MQGQSKKMYDATALISENLTVYPGDKNVVLNQIKCGSQCCFLLTNMSFSNHIGTHVDFPSHVVEGGKTSSDFNLCDLSGEGLIVQIDKNKRCITAQDIIENPEIKAGLIIIFKTANSDLPMTGEASKDFVYIEPSAAEQLVKREVKMVGIDYLSVDQYNSQKLPTHHILLQKNILLMENVCVKDIEPGHCYVQVATLKLYQLDGAPARIIIHK